jgi:heptosyltransferase-1
MRRFREELAGERYDCIVDTQGLLKSALIAALARGPRHGYDRASAREPIAARFYAHRHAVSPLLHAVERNRRLAGAALGYGVEGDCDYGLRATGSAPANQALLLTMTSRAYKLWPEASWRSLGEALAARGLQCVLPWGSEEERERCERIAGAIRDAVVPPRLALAELARLAAGAHAVIGVDTGLTHLAAALGAPAIGLYCGSDPALTGLYGTARAQNLGRPGQPPTVAQVLERLP